MYPRLLRRIQAVLIDSVITPVVFFISIIVVGTLPTESSLLRGFFSFAPALSMEPLLVAFTGGTIGHHIIGLKVRYVQEDKYISIFHALLRFVLKIFLGLPSLILVLITKRHQAIHDALSQAIVVHKSTENLPNRELLEERITEEEGFKYPSAVRRGVVTFTYLASFTVLLGIVFTALLSEECVQQDICNDNDKLLGLMYKILFWAVFLTTIIMGYKSRLYGCRRKRKEISNE